MDIRNFWELSAKQQEQAKAKAIVIEPNDKEMAWGRTLAGRHTTGPFVYVEGGDGETGLVRQARPDGRYVFCMGEPSSNWFADGHEEHAGEQDTSWITQSVLQMTADGHMIADALTVLTHPGFRLLTRDTDGAWMANMHLSGEETYFMPKKHRRVTDIGEFLHALATNLRKLAKQQEQP
jgi:hypothetical protein